MECGTRTRGVIGSRGKLWEAGEGLSRGRRVSSEHPLVPASWRPHALLSLLSASMIHMADVWL